MTSCDLAICHVTNNYIVLNKLSDEMREQNAIKPQMDKNRKQYHSCIKH